MAINDPGNPPPMPADGEDTITDPSCHHGTITRAWRASTAASAARVSCLRSWPSSFEGSDHRPRDYLTCTRLAFLYAGRDAADILW